MRASLLLVAALALCVTRASAETGAVAAPKPNFLGGSSKKNAKTEPEAQGLAQPGSAQADSAESLPDSAPAREASDPIFADPGVTTPIPPMHIIGPVLGGVAGAATLAGVIAISVMKKPKPQYDGAPPSAGFSARTSGDAAAAPAAAAEIATSLTAPVAKHDTSIEVADTSGFTAGDTILVGEEYQMVSGIAPSGGVAARRLAPGSIVLQHPMNNAQATGSVVKVIVDVASTTPAPAPAPAQPLAKIAAKQVAAKQVVTDPTVAPNTTDTSSSGSAPISGSQQSTVLAIACVLVVCGLLSVCIVGLLYFLFGRKKKRKTQPRQETPYPGEYPEDQQPLNQGGMGTMVDMQQTAPDLCESQYMQVQVPPLQAAAPPTYGNIGSIPTMQNVVPMHTMPPPPPPPMAMSYAPAPATGGSLFSQPAGSVYAQQGQSVYAQQGQSLFTAGSHYQNASPLANTVNALPTTAFASMQQLPPTIY